MPDLKENELPERQFFYGVLSTLYPDEMKSIIKAARKHRSISQSQNNDEKVELTDEIKNEIDEIFNQPSI